ncbi:2734_t:CDS:2 [Paraglomus occultum]|uniref:2734_t:CDS:1 n=1 Tax=Paraglomus occultum TaxID=144539 RepID=A0A9N9BAS2_9GLOM|nr:2734_t:CDS:2 [Paraglomus occultum]
MDEFDDIALRVQQKLDETFAVLRKQPSLVRRERDSPELPEPKRIKLSDKSFPLEAVHRPLDRDNFLKRPNCLSPLECAKYGWINTDQDVLECKYCGSKLMVRLPKPETVIGRNPSYYTQIEQMENQFVSQLSSAHIVGCPWRDQPCDDSIYKFPISHPSEVLEDFRKRATALLELGDKLPVVDVDFSEELIQTIIQALSLDESVDEKVALAAGCLSIFGYELHSSKLGEMVLCRFCFNRLPLHMFRSLRRQRELGRTDHGLKGVVLADGLAVVANNSDDRVFNLQHQHQWWCAWLTGNGKEIEDVTAEELEKRKPGWHVTLECIIKYPASGTEEDSKQKDHRAENIRNILSPKRKLAINQSTNVTERAQPKSVSKLFAGTSSSETNEESQQMNLVENVATISMEVDQESHQLPEQSDQQQTDLMRIDENVQDQNPEADESLLSSHLQVATNNEQTVFEASDDHQEQEFNDEQRQPAELEGIIDTQEILASMGDLGASPVVSGDTPLPFTPSALEIPDVPEATASPLSSLATAMVDDSVEVRSVQGTTETAPPEHTNEDTTSVHVHENEGKNNVSTATIQVSEDEQRISMEMPDEEGVDKPVEKINDAIGDSVENAVVIDDSDEEPASRVISEDEDYNRNSTRFLEGTVFPGGGQILDFHPNQYLTEEIVRMEEALYEHQADFGAEDNGTPLPFGGHLQDDRSTPDH